MAENSKSPQVKSKIKKIQQMYGEDSSSATLEQTSAYLKSKGFKSLGDLLVPAK